MTTKVNRSKLETELKSLADRFSRGEVDSTVTKSIEEQLTKSASALLSHGNVQAGFQALSSAIEENVLITKNPIPVRMTSSVPNLTVTNTSSQKTNLTNLIGTNIEDGLLKAVISSGAPSGIQNALKESISATTDQMAEALRQSTTADRAGTVQLALKTDQLRSVNSSISQFTNLFRGASVGIGTLSGVLSAFIGKLSGADGNPSISETIVEDTTLTSTTRTYTVEQSAGEFNEESTSESYEFETVSSIEELLTELKNPKRDITEVVVNWTSTFIDQILSARDIQIDLGKPIPYHFIIRRDGTLQRGRPITLRSTAEAVTKGHVQYSISLAFVAGYDALAGTPNKDFFLSRKSINEKQMKTFREFCAQFYTAYPGGQVLGYNDLIGDSRLGPGFSVEEYVKDNFEKTILIDTLMNSSSLSPLQIIEKSKGTTTV